MTIKHFKMNITIVCLFLVALFSFGGVMIRHSIQRSRQSNYRISSATRYHLRIVDHDGDVWNRLPDYSKYRKNHAKVIGTSYKRIGKHRLVKLRLLAKVRHNSKIYFKVSRQGRSLGWVRARDLVKTQNYYLPYKYYSQFWPSPARDACEVAALKIALSDKGKALHTSLRTMVKRIPHSDNPEKGYTNNPYVYGSHAAIDPKALAKVARHYGVKSHSITGASEAELLRDVKRGNPVVLEGPYRMRNTKSDHSLVLLGYRPGKSGKPANFYYVDPFSKSPGFKPVGWVNIHQFMTLFKAKRYGQKALVIE